MRTFDSQVLGTKGSDAERWRSLVNRCPQRDIFFAPEYAEVFERTEGATRRDFGGEPLLFFVGNETNFIIYPFFRRRIGELPFYGMLGSEPGDWFDVASPYGYGGPLAAVRDPWLEESLWQAFWEEFHKYCVQHNIVAEFARLHPYFRNHLALLKIADADIAKRSTVVYVDLEQEEALLWKNLTKGNRSSVSKARRHGVEIRCSTTEETMDAFYRLYTATMKKNEAKEGYFFSRGFLTDTLRLLGDGVKLFGAWYENRVVAASLFLFGGNLAHYYLSGSDPDYLFLSPNNLLLYEVILWARARGYKTLNLGGGYELGDSLFQFKLSFAKTTADFYAYARVHNQPMYEELCKARELYGELKGEATARSDYFPGYRR